MHVPPVKSSEEKATCSFELSHAPRLPLCYRDPEEVIAPHLTSIRCAVFNNVLSTYGA